MQEETSLETFFDIGDINGYEVPDENAFPVFPASPTKRVLGADGKRITVDTTIRLFRLSGPFKPGMLRIPDLQLSPTSWHFWETPGIAGRALSVYPAETEPKRRVSIGIDIFKLIPPAEVDAATLADETVPEHLRQGLAEDRKTRLGKAKGRAMLLAKALIGTDDLNKLATFLQTTDAEGAIFGAGVSLSRDGSRNYFTRFYPAAEATEPLPE